MLLKYDASQTDFVNTSEAYSRGLYVGNSNIIIPYVNVGLMPMNPINSKQSVIDYSYYVLESVCRTSYEPINDQLTNNLYFDVDELRTEYVQIGNASLGVNEEIEVVCRKCILYFSDDAIFSMPFKPFVPFDTPNFKGNLEEGKVDYFFSAESLPRELISMLGSKFRLILPQ